MASQPTLPPESPPSQTGVGADVKPYTAPSGQVWGWGAGKVAEFGLVAMFGQAMNIFTVGFGLSPVIVSWCMMLPRLIDGLVDPVIGHWSDNVQTPWGRRKPFMLFGSLVGAVFLSVLWWASPQWSHTAQFLFLGTIGTLLYLCYGTYVMAWSAVGYELSDDYHERARIQAVAGFFTAAMGLLFNWMYWLALRPIFGGVVWGMRWIGLGVALLIVVSALIAIFSTRERFTHANRTHTALLPAIKATLSNRPFVVLLLMRLFETCGGRLTGGLAFFLTIYYVCRGDQDLGTRIGGIGATIGTIWSFAVLPFARPASRWIGKRGALILGASLGFLGALVTPFIVTPEHPYWGLIPTLFLTPILALSGIVVGAILPDICDVDELQTGQRREGLFTSVMAFVTKMEISLAVVLVGFVVTWSGVDTKIALRWQEAADGRATTSEKFLGGEKAVFSFAGNAAQTFNTLTLHGVEGDAAGAEVFVGNTSPTREFRSLGKIPAGSTGPTSSRAWKFPTVTAKYVKIELPSAKALLALSALSLTNGDDPRNLLAAENNGRVAAAEPPSQIGRRLYWLVMIPGIVFSGLTLAMAILFPLTEEGMKETRRKLDEMHLGKTAKNTV